MPKVSLKRPDYMAVCHHGITQFYMPYTHLPLLPTAPWLVLVAPTHEGMARLS